ncbi:MAG: hypothetical protein JWQ98_3026 [Chlorobi bacterium]|nr:hypothetical protein [Chlorobiota bacterium]
MDRNHAVPASIRALCWFLLMMIPAHLRPANFPADDTCFYLQVAWNIFQGHGNTFNPITPTNGYHPLRMLFRTATMAIAGGDTIVAIYIEGLWKLRD